MTDPYREPCSNAGAQAGTLSATERFAEHSAGNDALAEELRANGHSRPLPTARDAFEADFFQVSRAGTLGTWSPVADTTVYPWRAVAYLDIVTVARNGSKENWRGTGFLVSPRTLVTAGHNVYFHDHGGWANSIEVHPGRNANGSPYGAVVARKFFSVRGWTDGRSNDYDYGAIVLDQDLGTSLGYFGLLEPSVQQLAKSELQLAGYSNPSGEQVGGQGRSQSPTTDLRIYYDVPTAIGQSGAPLWFRDDPRAVAVHGYESSAYNSGVRVNAAVHSQLRQWRQ